MNKNSNKIYQNAYISIQIRTLYISLEIGKEIPMLCKLFLEIRTPFPKN